MKAKKMEIRGTDHIDGIYHNFNLFVEDKEVNNCFIKYSDDDKVYTSQIAMPKRADMEILNSSYKDFPDNFHAECMIIKKYRRTTECNCSLLLRKNRFSTSYNFQDFADEKGRMYFYDIYLPELMNILVKNGMKRGKDIVYKYVERNDKSSWVHIYHENPVGTIRDMINVGCDIIKKSLKETNSYFLKREKALAKKNKLVK